MWLLAVFIVGSLSAPLRHATEAANSDLITSLPGANFHIPFLQYAGFVQVDSTTNRNLFYWYTQSQSNPHTDPLILWLNGGPGCSSLGGLFTEQGPFRPTKGGQALYVNPYAWNNRSNVIFLESPAGVGFSYSGNTGDYHTGDARTAADSVAFLEGFLARYPEFVGRPFWVSGESYAGHYTIELVIAILEAQKDGRLSGLNLKGFAAGNAWTDPASDNRGAVETWWNRALISDSIYRCALASCDFDKIGPLTASDDCNACLATAQASFSNIDIYDIYVDVCYSSEDQHYAVSQLARAGSPVHKALDAAMRARQQKLSDPSDPAYVPCIGTYMTNYLTRPDVITAIHASASPLKWTQCSNVVNYSYADVLTSVVPLYHKLLTNYPMIKIYVYSGDVDAIVPYWGSRQWISSLGLPVSAPWRGWSTPDDRQAGGFVQEYNNGQFTFITIRDAGHMVPGTQPKRAYHMINHIVNGDPL